MNSVEITDVHMDLSSPVCTPCLTPSPRLGSVSMLVQYFAMSIHTKTGIKYMLMTLSYASPHSHFSLSFYPLTTWCRSCICKLSQFIPHVISSPSPTSSHFCLTHFLQVLFWRFAQRRHPTLWEFLSPAVFLTWCTQWLFRLLSGGTKHHSQKQAVWPWP